MVFTHMATYTHPKEHNRVVTKASTTAAAVEVVVEMASTEASKAAGAQMVSMAASASSGRESGGS